MCRCKDTPACKASDCKRRADCDTDGFCYEHDPFDFSDPAPVPVPTEWLAKIGAYSGAADDPDFEMPA